MLTSQTGKSYLYYILFYKIGRQVQEEKEWYCEI